MTQLDIRGCLCGSMESLFGLFFLLHTLPHRLTLAPLASQRCLLSPGKALHNTWVLLPPPHFARMLAAQEETWSSHRAHLMFSPFQGSLFPDVQCLNILLSFSFPKESDFGHCYCILAKSGISPLT